MSIDKTNTDYKDFIELDEIVFEHRNKGYGAYNLRKIYGKVLAKSFIFGTVVFLAIVITPFIYMTMNAGEVKEEIVVSVDLTDIKDLPPPPKEELELPKPPPPKKEEPKQEIVKDLTPEPKPSPKVEEPPKKIEEVVGTTIGIINQKGEKKPEYIPPPPPVTGSGLIGNTVYEGGDIDQEAEFSGGIDRFRNLFQSRFDNSSLEGEDGIIRAEITFVVERDGTITDIKVNGLNADFNREALRTIKSIKTKWSPAKLNGQTVRSRFRFPVTMTFS